MKPPWLPPYHRLFLVLGIIQVEVDETRPSSLYLSSSIIYTNLEHCAKLHNHNNRATWQIVNQTNFGPSSLDGNALHMATIGVAKRLLPRRCVEGNNINKGSNHKKQIFI